MRSSANPIQLVAEGQEGTMDYRLRFKDASGREISPWHDVPLSAGKSGIFNAVIEIPKMAKAKMEVATKETNNAIAQDVKKGKLRDYHGPIYWNYGMLPQTWESPHEENPEVKCRGDNDPLDVVEIGNKPLALGAVEPIKPLGVLAMIDDGELDWKVIAISTNDPLSAELEDIDDVEKHCPGMISGIREWFRWYKTPDGKPLNQFGFNEAALNRNKALAIIDETHEAWRQLVTGRVSNDKLWVPSEKSISSHGFGRFRDNSQQLHAVSVAGGRFRDNSKQLHAVSVAGTNGWQKQPRGWQKQPRSKL